MYGFGSTVLVPLGGAAKVELCPAPSASPKVRPRRRRGINSEGGVEVVAGPGGRLCCSGAVCLYVSLSLSQHQYRMSGSVLYKCTIIYSTCVSAPLGQRERRIENVV